MSDSIQHECGLALVRLLKPLDYYQEKYGSALWGLRRMFLLMEKQHNRGQDAAGMSCVKLDVDPGRPYIAIEKSAEPVPPWQDLMARIERQLNELRLAEPGLLNNPARLKQLFGFAGELYLGHLRYATHSDQGAQYAHPFWRENNWKTRNLLLAGNFNMTNVDELFAKLVELGQYPRYKSDTVTVMERMGHFLDRENERQFRKFKDNGSSRKEATDLIAQHMDVLEVLRLSAKYWDGGYVLGGLMGHGDLFAMRDPTGIRPCFYYISDEIVTVASERPAIVTAFNLDPEEVQELLPGQAIIVRQDGRIEIDYFAELADTALKCSFERIYFSRGNDQDIYNERKALGRLVAAEVLDAIDHDLDRSVFSYIPNTAQVSYWGMLKGLEDYQTEQKIQEILELGPNPPAGLLRGILQRRVTAEYVVIKDTRLRTFITEDSKRDSMAAHVYDITYGTVRPGVDNLVCIDDSIVRGTTLKQSILKILARLKPKKIVIVSSAPQIRYPDCYGIDMSQLGKFIAFQAAVELLKDNGLQTLIDDTYRSCLLARERGTMSHENLVKAIYAPFTERQISAKISDMLKTPELGGCEVQIVFQPLANLPQAIPGHRGDWYFSGNYPTPGGNRVVNQAFINFYEGRNERAY